MPYIVTAKRPCATEYGAQFSLSRRAVATLEEAQETAWDVACNHLGGDPAPFVALPESGGTVGPLPNGTVIEVEQTTWAALAEAADEDWWIALAEREDEGNATARQTILDAYNARQA
jgi:hypothetical protein